MSENYPIDFVVTWVDGNDPVWQAEKAKYQVNVSNDDRNIRYREWDNLQYFFRGVDKFAPWVNKVYLVTYGHYPKWLNLNCKKLSVVKHEDFMNKKYLPTFNCNPIALNIFRIKDLSERFVFFNDDMFLLRPVKRELFFAGKDCLPTDFAIASTLSTTNKYDTVQFMKFNNITIINTHFDKKEQMKKNFTKWINYKYGWNAIRNLVLMGEHHFKCFANNHLAFSYLKSECNDLWDKEFIELDETCSHKFRSKLDYTDWLIRYWQLAKGCFEPIGRHDKNGEQIFMNIHQIWYGPIVYPIIAVLVLIALFLMIQTYKYIKKEQIICSIPRYSIRLFIIMMILSQIVFEKNLIKFLADYGQLLEECTEILAYCSLVCFTYDISFKKK